MTVIQSYRHLANVPTLQPTIRSSRASAAMHQRTQAPEPQEKPAASLSAAPVSKRLTVADFLQRSTTDRNTLGALTAAILERFSKRWPKAVERCPNQIIEDKKVQDAKARASQAESFLTGAGTNPFQGMPRDALTPIVESRDGAFTLEERRAAQMEIIVQDEVCTRLHRVAQVGCADSTRNRLERLGRV